MASSLPIVAVGEERARTPTWSVVPEGPGSPASKRRCDHEPESLNCFKRRGGPKTQRGISLDDLWELNEGGGRQRRERV